MPENVSHLLNTIDTENKYTLDVSLNPQIISP